MHLSRIAVASLVVLVLGCAAGSSSEPHDYGVAPASPLNAMTETVPPAEQAGNREQAGISLPHVPATPNRKIIYNANVELVVESLNVTEAAVSRLVEAQEGYLEKSVVRAPLIASLHRTGFWTIRIPVARFSACMSGIAKLGALKESNVESTDVTEKFYDLQAHIKNNQVEEESLQKFLIEKSTTGTLDEILTIRKEIRAIRGEIDRQQGQLQRWSNDTSFATISLSIHEKDVPVVAAVPVVPTFLEQIRQTFSGSLEAMLAVCQALTLALVAFVPWIPMLLLALVVVWLVTPRRDISVPPSKR